MEETKLELLGTESFQAIPSDLYIELTREKLGTDIHRWLAHTPKERGRMLASHRISGMLELIERATQKFAYKRLRDAQKDETSGDSKTSKKTPRRFGQRRR